MNIICRCRRGGKTAEAIKLAAETWSYIVCPNVNECDRIARQAKEMGIDIPYPLTFGEFIEKRYYAKGIRGFIIDNAEMLLQSLTPVPIKGITVTGGWGGGLLDYQKELEEKMEAARIIHQTGVLGDWGKEE